ncbi:hypothetical protein CC86DRAFT_296553 [Ophiobolus disseminans]|uniref:4'-phosphopantetheinyl transferase domain-containing protein n=1 Tax=Ophiobolus disseminans TaxID=1469910 RepID=A0A6A6ZUR5_9PLEO|nr:hypothetical protein CC86DRAFT_296553 [Ophiobolus disseminans]
MTLRPFPFALRVGTDICNVSRLRQLLLKQRRNQPFLFKFVKRVLTEPERAYFWHRFGPQHEVLSKVDAVAEYISGRYVATIDSKEAIRKACDHLEESTRGYHHIMILPITPPSDIKAHRSAPPRGLILDAVYEPRDTLAHDDAELEKNHSEYERIDANSLSGQLCEISISHDGDFATAVALVPTQPHHGTKASELKEGYFKTR